MVEKSLVNPSGLVVNRVLLEEGNTWAPPVGFALVDGGEIGDTWDGTQFIAPAPGVAPTPTGPQVISDRQFFQQLAILNMITKTEALNAVKTGAIPPLLQGIVDALPDEDSKFAAEMLLSGATEFLRNHPLVAVFAASMGMSGEDVDAFFDAAADL